MGRVTKRTQKIQHMRQMIVSHQTGTAYGEVALPQSNLSHNAAQNINQMFSFDDAEDPLADPFAAVPDDPFKDVTQPENAESSDEDAPLAISAHPATLSSSKINLKVYKIPVVKKISIVREKAGGKNGYMIKNERKTRNGIKKDEKVNSKNLEKIPIKKEEKLIVKKLEKVVTKKNGFKKEAKIEMIKKVAKIDMIKKEDKEKSLKKVIEGEVTEKVDDESLKKVEQKFKANGINGQNWERVCVELDPAVFFPNEPVVWPKCRSNYKSTKTFRCKYCGKGYNMLRALNVHSESRHGMVACGRVLACEVCPAVLLSPRALATHRASHVHHGRLPCLYCMPPLAQPGDTWCGIDESADKEPEPVRTRFTYRKHPTWWFYSVKGLMRHRATEHPEAGTLGVDWHGQWGDR